MKYLIYLYVFFVDPSMSGWTRHFYRQSFDGFNDSISVST